jgi:hypothetical protein
MLEVTFVVKSAHISVAIVITFIIHTCIAADVKDTIIELVRKHGLPNTTQVKSWSDLESSIAAAYAKRDEQELEKVDGENRSSTAVAKKEVFGDLAESLMIGRGDVCIGSPRSTYSKLATTWW